MSTAQTSPRRRRLPPLAYYLLALAGALVLPILGRLGQFMGDFGVLFYSGCALAILPWTATFCWLAWRRTDEVARAAHKTAWTHGATVGASIALACLLVALVFAVGQSLTFRMSSTHLEEPAAGAQPWEHTISLATGDPGTAARKAESWSVQGTASIAQLFQFHFAQGLAAGVLLTLLLQALCAMAIWGGWWARIWGAGWEKNHEHE